MRRDRMEALLHHPDPGEQCPTRGPARLTGRAAGSKPAHTRGCTPRTASDCALAALPTALPDQQLHKQVSSPSSVAVRKLGTTRGGACGGGEGGGAPGRPAPRVVEGAEVDRADERGAGDRGPAAGVQRAQRAGRAQALRAQRGQHAAHAHAARLALHLPPPPRASDTTSVPSGPLLNPSWKARTGTKYHLALTLTWHAWKTLAGRRGGGRRQRRAWGTPGGAP